MGETKIEWCDFTHNFWVGCAKLSAACDFCYAETWAKRAGHPELWQGERRRTKTWAEPHKWNKRAAGAATRPKVFTNSLADFFDNQVPNEWRADAWRVIDETPNLDWLILTKRPQNIAKMLPAGWNDGLWPNVWLGMTAENQDEYDRRANHLYKVPAAVRFISYEPALGPLMLDRDAPLDWLIVGGESGPHARAFDLEWARRLRDQCRRQGIYFFVKQMGGKRKPFAPIPNDLMIREYPRSAT
jgi:protein gp37